MRALIVGLAVFLLALAPAGDGIPSFAGNSGWLNGAPLQPSDLQGKIVLVDFWDYTCINCLRTLPYLRNLYERYHDLGLVIVGVHAPEFPFAAEKANVTQAVERLGVRWPIVLDDDFNVWRRYKNDGWPHEYLYDQSGRLAESFAGEGNYQATEANIQALLRRQNPQVVLPPLMALLPQDDYTKPGALCYPRTDEVILAEAPIANAAAHSASPFEAKTYYDQQPAHKDGSLYLDGFWDVGKFAALSENGNGYAALRYHAIQVVGVLSTDGGPVRVDVTQDGAPVPRADAGGDIHYDAAGKSYITVDTARAYDLVMNAKFGDHELRLHPQGKGVGIYSFAFESCVTGGS